MKRLRDTLLTVIFSVFIFGIMLLFVALPKAEISVNEKRSLAELPEVSIKKIFNGSFEKAAEAYISDHFPARDTWVSLDAYCTLYAGMNGVNGVYKGKDGYLINTPVKSDNLSANLDAVNAFADKINCPITLMVIPTAGSIMSDKLPENHTTYHDDDMLDRISADSRAEFIDLRPRFNELKDTVQLYYKTDHHWTSDGAYEAYRMYQPDAADKSSFNKEEYDGFFGTAYSKAALWHEKGEHITLYTYPADVSVTIRDGVKESVSDDMFFRGHLDEGDKYPVFLDGNHAYVRIVNNSVNNGRLLMVKDSYAHCLAPFLARHYNIVDMVDLRYYLDAVSKLADSEQYDKILFVYGLSNFAGAADINILE